ncbi:hypothetical protein M406DRAFT_265357 [Cryphonectria parasitica EP155]|uniref:NAD(P)-binding domain-containing protein n=1 Tax=Cryphonectria parasitica (strain ATCC 38755 / EP155) TaxID=660469 RepID=A0A9P4XVL7_CRYP1|nr:uncharacterized protein M406DRAFT_265357 [Cryphonectria parasitica EP155]KAF3761818.1 hypothetical protein M406DRAFT_265357 [Cryphonectria parasitica EP155]
MKLIVAGGTGFVATEVIRQSLELPEITSLVVLARKPVPVPDSPGSSKMKTLIIRDYDDYPDDVKAEFAGAAACIWTVAITPGKARAFDPAEVKRVCQTCTLAGMQAMYDAKPAKPFVFVYLSAEGLPEDPKQKPLLFGEHRLMRAETEKIVRQFAAQRDGLEIHVARLGLVTSAGVLWQAMRATNMIPGARAMAPNVSRTEVAAAILDQLLRGFERETLSNADLARIGQAAMKAKGDTGQY